MLGHTHKMGGIALTTTMAAFGGMYLPQSMNPKEMSLLIAFVSAGTIGAILPDIDQKSSTISSEHPVISFFTRLFLTHRGFTHSLLCYVLLAVCLFPVSKFIPFYGTAITLGILVGYGSHILLDAFNKKGVPLLFPFVKTKVSFGSVKTGGIFEGVVFLLLLLVVAGDCYIIVSKIGLL